MRGVIPAPVRSFSVDRLLVRVYASKAELGEAAAAEPAAAMWTYGELTEQNRDYLRDLPKGPVKVAGFQIIHGSPIDEDEYVLSSGEARQVFEYLEYPLTFYGHTHMQGGFFLHRNGIRRIGKVPADCEQQIVDFMENMYCLANPGSVGQPRDGDPRAAYVVYDTEERALFYRRTAYDIKSAQAKILKAGLPDTLALRLEIGA